MTGIPQLTKFISLIDNIADAEKFWLGRKLNLAMRPSHGIAKRQRWATNPRSNACETWTFKISCANPPALRTALQTLSLSVGTQPCG